MSLVYPARCFIASLPNDVLGDLFMQLVGPCFPSTSSATPGHVKVMQLSHVCRKWYYLMLDLPLLWSQIPLDSPEYAQLFLARSKNVPITLYAELLSSFNEVELRPHLTRVKSIKAYGTPDGFDSLFHILESHDEMPQLTHLEIGCRLWFLHGLPSIKLRVRCPSLHSIIVKDLHLDAPQLFSIAHTLEMIFTFMDHMTFAKMTTMIPNQGRVQQLIIAYKPPRGLFKDLESYESDIEPPPVVHKFMDKIALPYLKHIRIDGLKGVNTLTLLDLIDTNAPGRICFPHVEDLIKFLSVDLHPTIQRMQACSSDHHLEVYEGRYITLLPSGGRNRATCNCYKLCAPFCSDRLLGIFNADLFRRFPRITDLFLEGSPPFLQATDDPALSSFSGFRNLRRHLMDNRKRKDIAGGKCSS